MRRRARIDGTAPALRKRHDERSGPAPDDRLCEAAWTKIMVLAETHALIVQAYGGVATLALPVEQRKAGIRNQVLAAGLFQREGG